MLSFIHFTHGEILNECNQPAKSLEQFERAIELFDSAETCPEASGAEFVLMYRSRAYSQFGNSLNGAGRFKESEHYHMEAIRLAHEIDTLSSIQKGYLHTNLGSCYLWAGEIDKAERLLRYVLHSYCANLDCTLYALANVSLRQGKFHEALVMHERACQLFRIALGDSHHFVADSLHKIGCIMSISEYANRDLDKSL